MSDPIANVLKNWSKHCLAVSEITHNDHDTDMYIFTLGYLSAQQDLLTEIKAENDKLKKELENV